MVIFNVSLPYVYGKRNISAMIAAEMNNLLHICFWIGTTKVVYLNQEHLVVSICLSLHQCRQHGGMFPIQLSNPFLIQNIFASYECHSCHWLSLRNTNHSSFYANLYPNKGQLRSKHGLVLKWMYVKSIVL